MSERRLSDDEVCGETVEHQAELKDERDGVQVYLCRRCGAEIIEETDVGSTL